MTRAWQSAATLGAQSLSSVTNFAAGALALSAGDLAEFGRFSIAFQLCLVVIAVGQGSTANAVLLHSAIGTSRVYARSVREGASRVAIALGVSMGIPLALAAFVVGGQMRTPLLLAAAGSPGLVAQYTLRSERFARNDPLGALRTDGVWLAVLLVAAIADATGFIDLDANGYLAAWLLGAAIAAIPSVFNAVDSGWHGVVFFWRVTGPQAIRLGLDGMLARSVFVVSLVLADLIVGGDASGILSAAVLIFSPLSVVHTSTSAIVVPAAIADGGVRVVSQRFTLAVAGAVAAITVVWSGLLLALDESASAFGPFELDENDITMAIFAATALRFVGLAIWRGPIVSLRIADAASETLEARLIATGLQWTLPAIGFAAWGLNGGAYGLALATLFGAGIAWQRFATLRPDQAGPAESDPR
ncbi:MAG: hypothetical protein IH940_04045 [Acidobacteria bacterium]|nr:hypothetical protein [Acidobacteriota bacterium]